MEHSLTSLEEKFKTLPPDVQHAITSVDIARQLTDIGKKHHLHVDQLDELFDEAGLVMLGLTKPRDLIKNLRRRVSISDDESRAVVHEIDVQIFSPIRESLKKIHGVNDASTEDAELSDEERGLSREEILRDIEDKEEEQVADNGARTGEKAEVKEGLATMAAHNELQAPAPHDLVALNTAEPPLPQKNASGAGSLANRIQGILKGAPGAIHHPDIASEEQKAPSQTPAPAPVPPLGTNLEKAATPPYREKFEKVVSTPKETVVVEKKAASDGVDPYREPLP